ncbi:GNAT family N-acetyltransferase [uncultured Microbacterium sp.]|uniref:GNAT family N-acetyltransferase n=1 Tax=uncultured Microbacterium sp. TaxID=191216 RepID=UPI00262F15BD|nr:GNAT family N-acetyltransferase [uncultured Microbacterium sp.]
MGLRHAAILPPEHRVEWTGAPADTRVIQVANQDAGLIALRDEPDARWIEHFSLDPAHQGRGVGSAALETLLSASPGRTPFRLNVLQGSPARRLYERHGFVIDSQDDVDVWMTAPALRA